MTHKTKLKCRSGDTVTVHMNPQLVFRRELVLANCREDVTVEKVLSFQVLNFLHLLTATKACHLWSHIKNGQCLYYRKVLFQLMYNISLTGFAHCAIVVKQLCWNRTTKMVTSLVDGSLSKGQFRSFYNSSTRSKLKSFEDMTHKTKLKCRSGEFSTNSISNHLL
jgi:hypothetical protein